MSNQLKEFAQNGLLKGCLIDKVKDEDPLLDLLLKGDQVLTSGRCGLGGSLFGYLFVADTFLLTWPFLRRLSRRGRWGLGFRLLGQFPVDGWPFLRRIATDFGPPRCAARPDRL
jgi:hypothetical protein